MKNRLTACISSAVRCKWWMLWIIIGTYSCSVIRLKDREGKDRKLSKEQYELLAGTFKAGVADSVQSYYNRELPDHFSPDTLSYGEQCNARLIPVTDKRLLLEIYANDSLLRCLTLKGHFTRGYFRVRRKARAKFIAGPLLWVLAEDFQYIGLTNENDLVVLNSGGSGFLMVVAIPLFASGAGDFSDVYKRLE